MLTTAAVSGIEPSNAVVALYPLGGTLHLRESDGPHHSSAQSPGASRVRESMLTAPGPTCSRPRCCSTVCCVGGDKLRTWRRGAAPSSGSTFRSDLGARLVRQPDDALRFVGHRNAIDSRWLGHRSARSWFQRSSCPVQFLMWAPLRFSLRPLPVRVRRVEGYVRGAGLDLLVGQHPGGRRADRP